MNDLYKKLENNYKKEVIDYLKFLQSKGYILTRINENSEIWQYNARLNDFRKKYNIDDFINKELIPHVPNYFDIVFTMADYIKLIEKTFTYVTGNDIDNFKEYVNANKYIKSDTKLKQQLQQLKKQLEENKHFININRPDDTLQQIQLLTNNGVVFSHYNSGSILKKNGLFKYNETSKLFDFISYSDIINILENEFKTPFDTKLIRSNIKIYHDKLIYTDLPYQWNTNQKYKKIIKDYNNPLLTGANWK